MHRSVGHDAPRSPRVRRGKSRPALPSLGGAGRLRDPRLACFVAWDKIEASRVRPLDVRMRILLKPRAHTPGLSLRHSRLEIREDHRLRRASLSCYRPWAESAVAAAWRAGLS